MSSDYTKRIRKLRNVIKHKRQDNLASHFVTFFLIRYGYSGFVENDELSIWRFSLFAGIFYPVIRGKLKNADGKVKIEAKATLNPIAQILTFSTLFVLMVTLVTFFFEHPSWLLLLMEILLFTLFALFPILVVRSEKKYALEDLNEILEKINQD